jgi:hypothetical protein
MWPAGGQHKDPYGQQNAQFTSQDDAPLCFRLFGGYYSSGGPAPRSPGGLKTFWRANAQAAPGYV